MNARVALDIAPISLATTNGKSLRLESSVKAELSLSIAAGATPEEADGFGWSVIAAAFEFADSQGQCWKITSRFHSSLLIRTMMDFSSTKRICRWDQLDPEIKRKFEENVVLRDIWFSSDDRFIRPLIVGDKIEEVQFKYFDVKFEVAIIICDSSTPNFPFCDVFARTTSPMFNYKCKELPPLFFSIDWRYFLKNEYSADCKPSDIPFPLIAESTGHTGQPQPNVVVVN